MSADEVYVLGPGPLLGWLRRAGAPAGVIRAVEVQIQRADEADRQRQALDEIAHSVLPLIRRSDGQPPVLTEAVAGLADCYREAQEDAEAMAAYLLAQESATIGGIDWPEDVAAALDTWGPEPDDEADGGAA